MRLKNSTTVPICTGGEDIYLKENFRPLLGPTGRRISHPSGYTDQRRNTGEQENRRHGTGNTESPWQYIWRKSPIACMAAVHSIAATENFLALEFHSVDVPWWSDLVTGLPKPIVDNGYITVPDAPGLGIENLEDEVMREHLHPDYMDMWADTADWDNDYSHDRTWS
ncbi:MAG: enolase C-terminal domain-like protein [Enterocloster clostridioformis]